jgi:hypothetical protein
MRTEALFVSNSVHGYKETIAHQFVVFKEWRTNDISSPTMFAETT